MRNIIKKILLEQIINYNEEVTDYINKFDSDEQLLRSGGLPIDILDRLAHGFSEEDIKILYPKQLKIMWKDDYENVLWEIKKSGLTPKQWASKINLSEPIDVDYMVHKNKKGFFIQDGHHRYVAAKILNKPLNVNLEIKLNPIKELSNLSYDDFHRDLFKKLKK
jgi:hypothetical protein